MKLRVLFFSVLRDITGVDETTIELPAGQATVASLLDHLYALWPPLRSWDQSLLIALDHVYARRGDSLHEDAEVAIMPPVQGG